MGNILKYMAEQRKSFNAEIGDDNKSAIEYEDWEAVRDKIEDKTKNYKLLKAIVLKVASEDDIGALF